MTLMILVLMLLRRDVDTSSACAWPLSNPAAPNESMVINAKLIFHDKNSFVIWILMFELKHCIPINLDVDYGMFTITVNLMT